MIAAGIPLKLGEPVDWHTLAGGGRLPGQGSLAK
jgi:hypothetical protein